VAQDLEKDLAKATGRAEKAEAEKLKADEEMTNAGVQGIRFQDELDVLEKENQELHQKLTEIDTEGAASMMALEEQVGRVADLEEQIETLKTQQSAAAHNHAVVLRASEGKVVLESARATSAEDTLKRVEEVLSSLENEKMSLNAELEIVKTRCLHLGAKLSSVDTEGAATMSALDQQLAAVEQLEVQVVAQTSRAEKSESFLRQAEIEGRELRNKFAAAQTELQTLHVVLDEELARHEKTSTDLQEAQKVVSRNSLANTELEANVKKLQTDLEWLEQERQMLSNKLTSLNALLSTIESDATGLQLELNACKSELDSRKVELDWCNQELETCQNEFIASKKVLDTDSETSTYQLKIQAQQISALKTELEGANSEKRTVVDKMSVAKTDWETVEKDLTDQLAVTASRAEKLESDMKCAEDFIKRLHADRLVVEETLSEMDTDNKTVQTNLKLAAAREKERAKKSESDLRKAEEDVSRLNAQVSELEEKLRGLVEELEVGEAKQHSRQDESVTAKQLAAREQQRAETAEGNLLRAGEEATEMSSSLSSLEENLTCLHQAMSAMSKARKELHEKLATTEAERCKIQENLFLIGSDKDSAVTSLEERVSHESARAENAEARLAKAEEHVAELETQIHDLGGRLEEVIVENEIHRQDMENLQAKHLGQCASVKKDLEDETQRANQANAKLGVLTLEKEQLASVITKVDTENAERCRELFDRISGAEADLTKEKIRADKADADLNQVHVERHASTTRLSESSQSEELLLQDLRQKVLEETTRAEMAEDDADAKGVNNQHLAAERDALVEELKREASRAEHLVVELQKVEEEAHHRVVQIQELEDKLSCLGSDVDALESERDLLTDKVSAADSNVEAKADKVKELIDKISEMKMQRQEFGDKLSSLESELEAISAQQHTLSANLLSVKSQAKVESDKATELAAKITTMEADSHTRQNDLKEKLAKEKTRADKAWANLKQEKRETHSMREYITELSAKLNGLKMDAESATQAVHEKANKKMEQLKRELTELSQTSNARAKNLERQVEELKKELKNAHLKYCEKVLETKTVETEHAERCREMVERTAKLERDVEVEMARALNAVRGLKQAEHDHEARLEDVHTEMDAEHADRCRELADRISLSEAEAARLMMELADANSALERVKRQISKEIENAEHATAKLTTKLALADSALEGMRDQMSREMESAEADVARLTMEIAFANSALEGVREQMAKETEGAEYARASSSKAELEISVLKLMKTKQDQKIVDMQEEHEAHNNEIEMELTELYRFVEQHREAGDDWLAESEQYKEEVQSLRASLVQIRYGFFCKLLLLHSLPTESNKSETTPAKTTMFASPLEGLQQTLEASLLGSEATQDTQDSTFGPEGFETLPPLQMSSRKQRYANKRCPYLSALLQSFAFAALFFFGSF